MGKKKDDPCKLQKSSFGKRTVGFNYVSALWGTVQETGFYLFDSTLGNHALHGEYNGFCSINITGDIRAIYKVINESSIEFALLDSYSNLYS